jgi:hypothetical protein
MSEENAVSEEPQHLTAEEAGICPSCGYVFAESATAKDQRAHVKQCEEVRAPSGE